MTSFKVWTPLSLSSRCFGAAIIIGISLVRALHSGGWVPILDDANLVFHEAGHPLFGIFGPVLGLYGGTLGQLVFPTVTSVMFWKRGEPLGFALCLAWVFENALNISRYMADAQAQELPLVGGGEHDWTAIFTRWNVLSHDTQIAGFFAMIAWAGLIGCTAWLIAKPPMADSNGDN